MSKYIYINNGNVVQWTKEVAERAELENRELPEDQRHVEYETDKPDEFKWADGKVVYTEKLEDGLISLDTLKKNKTDEVNQICETKILDGFWSNATGTDRHYQSESEDQTNLVGAVTAQIDLPYKCGVLVSGKIEYSYVNHTAAQLLQVLQDGSVKKLLLLQNAYILKTQITDSQTQEQLLAININAGWE